MNRRSFLRSLGLATAALYLRFSPSTAKAIPASLPQTPQPVETVHDDCVRWNWAGGGYCYKGEVLTAEEVLRRFAKPIRHTPAATTLMYHTWNAQSLEWDGHGAPPSDPQ